jgi:hypothetical protein
LTLKVTDYVNVIDPDSHVNVYVIANVKETNQKYINRDIIRCERPNLELKVSKNTIFSFSQELFILTIAIISEYIPTNDNTYKNRKGEIIILNSVNMELISK